jgi:hypothetical protein
MRWSGFRFDLFLKLPGPFQSAISDFLPAHRVVANGSSRRSRQCDRLFSSLGRNQRLRSIEYIQQRLLQQGFPWLTGPHTVVDRNMVEMNLKNSKIIMLIFDIYDHLDSYREDRGSNWFSGS